MRRPPIRLATVMVAVMTEVEDVAAVVIPVAMLDAEVAMTIAFVGLRGALEADQCQQAETSRAQDREQLCTHGKLLSGRGERECMSDPLTKRRTGVAPSVLKRVVWPSGTTACVQRAFTRSALGRLRSRVFGVLSDEHRIETMECDRRIDGRDDVEFGQIGR